RQDIWVVSPLNDHDAADRSALTYFKLNAVRIAFTDVEDYPVADKTAAFFNANKELVFARQHAEHAKLSSWSCPHFGAGRITGGAAIIPDPANHDLHSRDRPPGASIHHTPGNIASLFWIGDGHVYIGGFRTFTDFDHLRLRFASRIRVKDARIECAARSNSG